MRDIIKYPRTQHVVGSQKQSDDDLDDVPFSYLIGKTLIVEEKMDGANSGISFDEDGVLYVQSRGHYLRGGPREKHFALLKQWASSKQEELFCVLGSRYVMYGEWLFAKHTFFYDALPHYFMEFDIYDTETSTFLDTPSRANLLNGTSVVPVKVLAAKKFDKWRDLYAHITRSHFISDEQLANLDIAAERSEQRPEDVRKHTDMDEWMEGIYIKWEEDGIVKGRYKLVRPGFTNSILEQASHWHDRPIVQNALIDGALENMFK